MAYRRFTDQHNRLIRRWLAGEEGPDNQQLPLPGMPEPPNETAMRLLAFLLNTYANADGTGIYPGKKALAHVTGLSRRSIQRCMQRYAELGLYVRVGDVPTSGRGNAQEWRCNIPDWITNYDASVIVSERKLRHQLHETTTPVSPHHSLTGNGPASPQRKKRVGAADKPPTELPRCDYADDGSGISCANCTLPSTHPRHRRAS
jgi:hypothetical protein